MRILCRLCKRNRTSQVELYHENPDPKKYYCFHSGDLTDSEYKGELLLVIDDYVKTKD